jgi:hypothetical protein
MPGTVQWKEATTVILRKPRKSDYTDPSSYRLIALLNTFGKALESDVALPKRKACASPGHPDGGEGGSVMRSCSYHLSEDDI